MDATFGSNGIVGIVVVIIILILVVWGIWWLSPENSNTFGTATVVAGGNAVAVAVPQGAYKVDLACNKGCKSKSTGNIIWAENGQGAYRYNFKYENLSGDATGASIRYANSEKVLYPLNLNGGNVQFNEKEIVALKNGQIVATVNSKRYPAGEIIGTLRC